MAVREGHALIEQENKSAGERKSAQIAAEPFGPSAGGGSRNYWPQNMLHSGEKERGYKEEVKREIEKSLKKVDPSSGIPRSDLHQHFCASTGDMAM